MKQSKRVKKKPKKESSEHQEKSQYVENKSIDEEDNILPTHKGSVIIDATACPQDIAYPTDIDLLNASREKSEQLIDLIYQESLHQNKPRIYREIARNKYLKIAQNKNKTKKKIRQAIRAQLNFLKRNLKHLNTMLDKFEEKDFSLKPKEHKYLLVIQELYRQQYQMYITNSHSVDDRIVSIHQPHVRPIVRGKGNAKVEFGSKINVSLVDGYSFLDELSWDAFNEGTHLKEYVEKYKLRFGYYPKEVLADNIYCNRENRAWLKEKGIMLKAKPLGRPSALTANQVRPGERNPIEGKFGQAKTGYGLNNIKARLKNTSETWIACIFLVLNLVKLAGLPLPCLFGFSAQVIKKRILQIINNFVVCV